MALNPKQKKFCQQYLIDLNATQAAIRAGYSEKAAKETGCRMLTNANIQDYISQLQLELQKTVKITPESVIAELAKIGFCNIQDFVNGGNSILELKHLDSNKTAAISGVKTTVSIGGDIKTEIKFYDKVSALEKIGRHMGIFKDKLELTGKDGAAIQTKNEHRFVVEDMTDGSTTILNADKD